MIPQLRRYWLNDSGNAALLFALALAPLSVLAGGMIDYSRAASARIFLQNALDAALLKVVADPTIALENRKEAIQIALEGYLKSRNHLSSAELQYSDTNGYVQVSAAAVNTNIFGSVIGLSGTRVAVNAAASAGGRETEVALVLDVTGSMRNDMAALRQSASDLVNALMSRSTGKNLRVSVVPYVASVNVGAANLTSRQIDAAAASRWHATHMRWSWMARIQNCQLENSGSNNNLQHPGTPSGDDKSGNLIDAIYNFATTLIGITPAYAEVTPSTRKPLQGTIITVPHVDGGTISVLLPHGFNQIRTCWMANPATISHVDLFNRIPNVTWKGCVEARPEPYDVTDVAPDPHDPNTLFVPYFWHDETDDGQSWWNYANNYMPDGDLPVGWVFHDHWHRNSNILKYDGVTSALVDETPPHTKGPNAGCPDELLPLTDDQDVILQKINSLSHWESGGTITSEGIAWGWRTLSPSPPFTEARPYGEAAKVLVVMTDGKNSFVANDVWGPIISEYTAYGFLRSKRFPNFSFSDIEAYLNQRTQLVCENAKREGVEIYTILFNEVDITARMMMQQCASSSDRFFYASSQEELAVAFKSIGESIGAVRLLQ
jgi:Flp pilus assembly protein TadG